jgi:hypothetical protein
MLQEFIILYGATISPEGELIRPVSAPTPIAKRPFNQNLVFGEDIINHRHYLGPMVQCQYCKAKLWVQERVSSSSRLNPKFSVCCAQGRVIVPKIQPDPDGLILRLLTGSSRESLQFRTNIRKYNTCTSFASMGANVDPAMANGKDGVYSFRIQGQVSHLLGSLLPDPDSTPGFSQLYIFDPQEQATRRNKFYNNQLDLNILLQLQELLEKYNPFCKLYRSIRERENGIQEILQYTIVIKGDVDLKGRPLRQYDSPVTTEVAGLLPGDPSISHRDIVVQHLTPKEGSKYLRIKETNSNYDGLAYPLLFPCGQLNWQYETFEKLKDPPRVNNSRPLSQQKQLTQEDTFEHAMGLPDFEPEPETPSQVQQQVATYPGPRPGPSSLSASEYLERRFPLLSSNGSKIEMDVDITAPAQDDLMPLDDDPPVTAGFVSMREYYAYQLQIRPISDTDPRCYFWLFERLCQQYSVDQYAKIESDRLRFIATHQDELLTANYQGLTDAMTARDADREGPQATSSSLVSEVSKVSRPVILPSSFTGGPRHMHQQFQDAMSIVRRYGKPDLFITFTCNPQWPEVQEHLFNGQTPPSRPDLTSK